MKPLDFCYWLQGYCEINGEPPTKEQWEMIKKHLQSCFTNEIMNTPNFPPFIPPYSPIWKVFPSNIKYTVDCDSTAIC